MKICQQKENENDLVIMSFNLGYKNISDGENSWDNRKDLVKEIKRKYCPGIIGIQEGKPEQVNFLKSNFNFIYDYLGRGRKSDF